MISVKVNRFNYSENKGKLKKLLFALVVVSSTACTDTQNQNTKSVTEENNETVKFKNIMTHAIYTANEADHSISIIELPEGKVSNVKIGHLMPHNVQTTQDGKLLLVTAMVMDGGNHEGHHGHSEASKGRLLVFDTKQMENPIANVEVGHHAAHVVVDNDGTYAYVTNAEDNTISVVDIHQKAEIATIPSGKFPHGLRLDPKGNKLYVANMQDNSVSVIDVKQRTEIARIPVGKGPVQVAFTPQGNKIYVSLSGENAVGVIDTKTQSQISIIPVGRVPIQLYATPDGKTVYVANQGNKESPDRTVSVIDAVNDRVITTIETGNGAHGVVVSLNGNHAYIANSGEGTVSSIDVKTNKVTQIYEVGDGPNGITVR